MTLERHRLHFLVIHDAAELPVNANLKVSALRFIIEPVPVVTPGNNVRMITNGLNQVDIPRWFECDHDYLSQSVRVSAWHPQGLLCAVVQR